MPKTLFIRCPKCNWQPDESCRWMCDVCRTTWNTFETGGQCPNCAKVFEETSCIGRRGGCGQSSPHLDWYFDYQIVEPSPTDKFTWFWQRKNKPPVTQNDKQWVEKSLLRLSEMIEPVVFKSLPTITPDKDYFDWQFTGNEKDAEFILQRLSSIMYIDPWEIQLIFYSNASTSFTEGIVATPQVALKGSWNTTLGHYIDKGLGNKEIWIELSLLKDPIVLIATMAHQLAHHKLLTQYQVESSVELVADLTAVVFGFGIFMGNSYFKFAQWTGTTHQGWQVHKRGYLPEQVFAYAMAWLAHYRNEDISWKHHLNKTMKKYFEWSYAYIENNKDRVLWE